MTFHRLNTVLIAAFFLLAPFTWSYIASVGGTLVRAVDPVLLMIIALTLVSGRIKRVPMAVPSALFLLVTLLILRGAINSEARSVLSALKITYYLVAALCIASTIIATERDEFNFSVRVAIFLISPIIGYFVFQLGLVFFDLIGAGSFATVSQIIFRGWNSIFTSNIFGGNGALEVKGISFRNSAGIAFIVAFLFFYQTQQRLGLISILLFFFAAILFSRSVWGFQLIFIALVSFSSDGRGRLAIVSLAVGAFTLLVAFPELTTSILDRLGSDFGRSQLNMVAISELDSNLFFGRSEGAIVETMDGEFKAVHNVPLAFALKTGTIGFILSVVIVAYFGIAFLRSLFALQRGTLAERRTNVVMAMTALILFSRPLISASHETFFSIGEWGAFALFLAFKATSTLRPPVRLTSTAVQAN